MNEVHVSTCMVFTSLCCSRDSFFYRFCSRGIFFVTKGTFGQLTCEWQYLFEEFTKEPMIVEGRRLRIEAKVKKAHGYKTQSWQMFLNKTGFADCFTKLCLVVCRKE